jgi:hypothetical protein
VKGYYDKKGKIVLKKVGDDKRAYMMKKRGGDIALGHNKDHCVQLYKLFLY